MARQRWIRRFALKDPAHDLALDRTRCPLCGEPNACAMEAGTGDCWCRDVSFAPSLFDRLPAGARGAACICRRCALAATPSPPPR